QDAIENAKHKELEQSRLADIQSRLRYEFAMELKTPYDVGQQAIYYVALTGRADAANDYYQTLATLSPKDVSRYLDRFLQKDGLTVLRLTGGAPTTLVEEIPALRATAAPKVTKSDDPQTLTSQRALQ